MGLSTPKGDDVENYDPKSITAKKPLVQHLPTIVENINDY